MSEPLWMSLDLLREAVASRALDGETQHVAAPDGSCCLDHARERIVELEDANTRMRQRLEGVEALKADAVMLHEMTLLERMWRGRIGELEAALEEIEWRDIGNGQEVCAYCDSWRSDGHHYTCVLGKALRREETDDDNATE